jgi:hypothetical protein
VILVVRVNRSARYPAAVTCHLNGPDDATVPNATTSSRSKAKREIAKIFRADGETVACNRRPFGRCREGSVGSWRQRARTGWNEASARGRRRHNLSRGGLHLAKLVRPRNVKGRSRHEREADEASVATNPNIRDRAFDDPPRCRLRQLRMHPPLGPRCLPAPQPPATWVTWFNWCVTRTTAAPFVSAADALDALKRQDAAATIIAASVVRIFLHSS